MGAHCPLPGKIGLIYVFLLLIYQMKLADIRNKLTKKIND